MYQTTSYSSAHAARRRRRRSRKRKKYTIVLLAVFVIMTSITILALSSLPETLANGETNSSSASEAQTEQTEQTELTESAGQTELTELTEQTWPHTASYTALCQYSLLREAESPAIRLNRCSGGSSRCQLYRTFKYISCRCPCCVPNTCNWRFMSYCYF